MKVWSRIRSQKKGRRLKSRRMSSRLLTVFIPIIILFGLVLMLLFNNLNSAKALAYRYLEDTAALNAERVNEEISKLNSETVYLLHNDYALNSLPDRIEPSDNQYFDVLNDIRTLNKTLKLRYDGEYYFYEYLNASKFMIFDNKALFPISLKTELEQQLEDNINAYLSGEQKRSEWNFLESDGDIYFFSFYESKGKSVGCISKLDDLFERFTLNNLGYQGIPYFITEDDTVLTTVNETDKSKIEAYLSREDGQSWWDNDRQYAYKLGRLGTLRLLITSENDILSRILFLQILSVMLVVATFIVAGIIGYRYYQTVLSPMKQFVDSIHDANEEKWLHETGNNRLLEVELASKEFRKLLKQIKALKIAIYERELFQSQTELEYVQELVKPHFYLNCLSIIHGKAELLGAEDIVSISEKLSNYMRYIINTSFELRPIRDELKHLSEYLDIQRFRYGDTFHVDIMTENHVEDYVIPPLVIQTFVENALKHGMTMEDQLEIALYFVVEEQEEQDYVYMCISDNGKGFDKEVLDKIEKAETIEYAGRKHVGIQNTKNRLRIIYGQDVQIKLSNMKDGFGGVVEIQFPAILQ